MDVKSGATTRDLNEFRNYKVSNQGDIQKAVGMEKSTHSTADYSPSFDTLGFYVGDTAGNIVIKLKGDATSETIPVLSNTTYPWGAIKTISNSGTTATDIWVMG